MYRELFVLHGRSAIITVAERGMYMKRNRVIRGLLAAAVLMSAASCSKHEAFFESTEDNTISVTANRSGESAGSGVITVAEGEILRVDYTITKGTFDIMVAGDQNAPLEAADPEIPVQELTEALEEDTEEALNILAGDGQYKETELSGEGSLDIAVNAGEHTLYITLHDATGEILVTAVPAE